jgi:hypothetical protein
MYNYTLTGDFSIPYVVFLDADCTFLDTEALVNFVRRFESNPSLHAISAHCVPDVCFNSRTDFISQVYRATESLARLIKINSISGMCYSIKFDVLRKIEFPDFQFAEDMFVSSRLNGWFVKDMDINILFETPRDFRSDLNRRARQEISSKRYREYFSYLKSVGKTVELFDEPLGPYYRWGYMTQRSFFRLWLDLQGVKDKFFIIGYLIIKYLAKIEAQRRLRKLKQNRDLDYWSVDR